MNYDRVGLVSHWNHGPGNSNNVFVLAMFTVLQSLSRKSAIKTTSNRGCRALSYAPLAIKHARASSTKHFGILGGGGLLRWAVPPAPTNQCPNLRSPAPPKRRSQAKVIKHEFPRGSIQTKAAERKFQNIRVKVAVVYFFTHEIGPFVADSMEWSTMKARSTST